MVGYAFLGGVQQAAHIQNGHGADGSNTNSKPSFQKGRWIQHPMGPVEMNPDLTTKKIWDSEETKDDVNVKFIGDGMWRTSTWSNNPNVGVSSSGFGSGSPRSENSAIGTKMVEYVLGESPTAKDLASRMRILEFKMVEKISRNQLKRIQRVMGSL